MAKVFLSYAREDLGPARHLAGWIEEAGHDVWWDREIVGGSRFAAEIDRALKDAEAVVVLWSEASVSSAWVQDEAAEGRDTGRLVPVALGCRPPLGFRQFHTIDFGQWNGSGEPANLDELLNAIGSTVGNAAAATPRSARIELPKRRRAASICVLPFVNMSGEPEQEYFSDGITEDIITDLSQISSLSVISRNTAFTFKRREIAAREVAETLDVSHVLEGSVRKAGDRVRITAQLIDGQADDHIWAERFDRDLTDIFAIQDEISKSIVSALQIKLLPEEKQAIANRGTANVDAYNLYLKARQQWIGGVYGDIGKDQAIVRICKQAVALDPDYAEAWALMALAQAELRFWHGISTEDALPAAERALSLNPALPEAMCVKARYLEQDGRDDEAIKVIEDALRLDPESWEVNREAARLLFREGRFRESIPYFEKASELMSGDFHSPGMLQTCYRGINDEAGLRSAAERAVARAEAAIAKDPANVAALAKASAGLVVLGNSERAKEWIDRASLLDPDNVSTLYNLACALNCELKDPDAALDMLKRFFDRLNSKTILKHIQVDPDMDDLRDHPRFKEMFAEAKARLEVEP